VYGDSSSDRSSEDDSIIIAGSLDDSDTSSDDNSSGDNSSDDEVDSEDGLDYDAIHNEDSLHFYSEKEHGNYYIGLCHQFQLHHNNAHWLFSTSVSARTFLQHSYDNINKYLYYYGLVRIPNNEVDIMMVHRLPDETCTVIIKTYWLRIVQRHWKRTYAMRMSILSQRISPQIIKYNEVHGCYPPSMYRMPSLTGMLRDYAYT
jgi:hypothetical protein